MNKLSILALTMGLVRNQWLIENDKGCTEGQDKGEKTDKGYAAAACEALCVAASGCIAFEQTQSDKHCKMFSKCTIKAKVGSEFVATKEASATGLTDEQKANYVYKSTADKICETATVASTTSSLNVGKCADKCSKDASCYSFSLKLADGECKLYSDCAIPGKAAVGTETWVKKPYLKCKSSQKHDDKGKCTDCGEYKTQKDGDATECVDPSCKANESWEKNGSCKACAEYKIADDTKKACKDPTCKANEMVEKAGTCKACAEYKIADDTKKACKDPTCKANQTVEKDGTCKDCAEYKVADDTKKACKDPTCKKNETVEKDGTCKACADYKVADDTKKACKDATACKETEMMEKDGTCKTCPDGTTLAKDKKSCACPEYKALDKDSKCADPTCKDNEMWQKDGTCKACDKYTAPAKDKKSCASPTCEAGQIVEEAGTCKKCDDYQTVGKDDKTKCIKQETCIKGDNKDKKKSQIIETNGNCKDCDDFKRAAADQKTCLQDECKTTQKLAKLDGTCEDCAKHFESTGKGATTCTLKKEIKEAGEKAQKDLQALVNTITDQLATIKAQVTGLLKVAFA